MINQNYSYGKQRIKALANKQAGGTLLGLIIGLIVGLGIAVVVAITISKATLPFSNKQSKAAERTAEMNASQSTDPNKPLYGKQDAAKEAAKDFAKPAGAPEPDDEIAKLAKADKPPADLPKPADKPAADIKAADSKTDATKALSAKPDGADDKYIYHLQAGAFREQADAENTRAKLALLGFEATISERPSDTGTLYRVRIGPFTQLEPMNRIRGKLSDNGVDAAVVRTAK